MSTTKAGGRSNPGMPDDYWRKAYDMRGVEIERLKAENHQLRVIIDAYDSAESWQEIISANRLLRSYEDAPAGES